MKQKNDPLEALKLVAAHYDDLSKSNPGFMGKLCLQDYALWNKAMMAMAQAKGMKKPKADVVIEVSGGCVQAVYSSDPDAVRVVVADHDNHEAGDRLCGELVVDHMRKADTKVRRGAHSVLRD